MRNVFGVISAVIRNLPITQEDIEYSKKVGSFTFDTREVRC